MTIIIYPEAYAAAMLFFLGTFCMLASFEEHPHNPKNGKRFFWGSLALYMLGGLLLTVKVQ
jgi:hypothetical protein